MSSHRIQFRYHLQYDVCCHTWERLLPGKCLLYSTRHDLSTDLWWIRDLCADNILTRVTVVDPWWLMRVATAPLLVWSHGAQDVLTLIILGYTPGDDTALNSSECKISFYLFLCYFLAYASSWLQGDKSALLDSGAHQWHHLPCPHIWVEDHCPEFICKQLL